MTQPRRPWQEELEIVDRTMKAISGVRDPEELVSVYWDGIGSLLPSYAYVAVSRRGIAAPQYLVTRSSRFTENLNPWTQRDRLPRLTGGLLGEIAFANKPLLIDDLESRLKPDDPGRFYLEGFESLIALPQYDGGEGINVTVMLMKKGEEISPEMLPMMHWQAGLFGRGTQNLVLRNQLSDALASLDRELQVVGEIQRSLLPDALPDIPGFEIGAHYITSARAGGDYYDFFPLSDGAWGAFIADVSGHGTPAAVLMAITHAIAHSEPGSHTPPAALLTYLNTRLARSYTRSGTFVTAFYAVIDPAKKTLTYSAAGHNPPRLVRNGKVISLSDAGAIPLGIMREQAYTEAHATLQSGDVLVLYTDGITEAMAPVKAGVPIRMFGVEGLDHVLLEAAEQSADTHIERIRGAVDAFTEGTAITDDRTVIVMRCL